MKNLVRTVFVSVILFLLVIFLGIKYHWITLIKNQDQNTTSLQIPAENQAVMPNNLPLPLESEQTFNAEIVNNSGQSSLLSNMTKSQIKTLCEGLFKNKNRDNLERDLLVGNCVVSNYEEPIQENSGNQNTQYFAQKNAAKRFCRNQMSKKKSKLPIERELLIGICISNQINR